MKKVLIADDDAVARALMKQLVEKLGHAAVVTSDGQRALQVLEDNNDFDLLITDAKMPELEGRDLILALQEKGLAKKLPVIMVSGLVGPNYIAELLEQGVTRFLPKPLDSSDFRAYVQRALGEK